MRGGHVVVRRGCGHSCAYSRGMAGSRTSWQTRAMGWPIFIGAAFGSYLSLRFGESWTVGSALMAVLLGSLCSLPAGALLGTVAVLVGNGVLAVAKRSAAESAPLTWRFAFAGATALAVAMIGVAALAAIGLGGSASGLVGLAVGAIAFVASLSYYPADSLLR